MSLFFRSSSPSLISSSSEFHSPSLPTAASFRFRRSPLAPAEAEAEEEESTAALSAAAAATGVVSIGVFFVNGDLMSFEMRRLTELLVASIAFELLPAQ